jgi:4-hydroxy-3-methylbut-2-enyl diphosphate reductase
MRLNLAKSAGFCFGVRRALDIAAKTAQSNKNVVMLGDIVHNEQVVNKIRASGIKKTGRLNAGKGKTLLIRAHGAPLAIFNKAKKLGYKIIDATCPMVKEIHKIAGKMENKGYCVIVIGDKEHDEVRGIIGQLKNKSIVIDKITGIPLSRIKKIRKACVVVQSTQNIDNTLAILAVLKKHILRTVFFNTICQPTRIKQEEIKSMPLQNDIMIIIGSRESANTRRLYEISKSLNKRSWRVNSAKEIKPSWLIGVKTIGITAGASTPQESIEEIISYLSNPPRSGNSR